MGKLGEVKGGTTDLLEQLVFGKPQDEKRAERMARSESARRHRRVVKQLRDRKETEK